MLGFHAALPALPGPIVLVFPHLPLLVVPVLPRLYGAGPIKSAVTPLRSLRHPEPLANPGVKVAIYRVTQQCPHGPSR